MNDIGLVIASLRDRWIGSTLSVLLTLFGVMLAVMIVQFNHHVQDRIGADGQGVDIVVGAKGSPLQLVLSSVYHIDIPTGNILYADAHRWMTHPQIKTAIPLALGDHWRTHRIVGTTPDYITHYGAELAHGTMWSKPFEAVVGAMVDLRLGDEFVGAHGLMGDGHTHGDHPYRVVGVMAPTGTVLDRLIITDVDSVLLVHGQPPITHTRQKNNENRHVHEHHAHSHDHGHEHEHKHADHDAHGIHPEITALLLTVRSPIAAINLPRTINRETTLQAANPALEIARLTSMLGVGSDSFALLAAFILGVAFISILAGLASGLENRMGDLAVLRAVGFTRARILRLILIESMTITLMGLFAGLLAGVLGFHALASVVPPLYASGAAFDFHTDFLIIIGLVIAAGILAGLIPGARAVRVDVAQQLSRSF